MLPVALSSTQNLTLVVVLLAVGGLTLMVIADRLYGARPFEEEIETALTELTESVKQAVDADAAGAAPEAEQTGAGPHAAVIGASGYLKALAETAARVNESRRPSTALVAAMIPFALAAALVGVDLFR